MTKESEYILEENLVKQLQELGYSKVVIKDENDLISNLKLQLEKHNNCILSKDEFKQILNALSKGNIYEKAKTLRDRITFTKDDGSAGYLEFINQIHWCKNQYQVTHQVTMEGKYVNRYDVTILINGLPLIQIELKRRGLELKEAFHQTNRYERQSYNAGAGLFQFIQLFVISNGVNTKYYANNPIKARTFKQTFYWADKNNKIITQLSEFTTQFLAPCHVSKMITKYTVLNTAKILMVLRPYQYYATEAIIERVKNSHKFGYIWHTTGSGKTLTSFKTAQILTNLGGVTKVVFVVDRKDLDYQTIKEFNSFSEGSIDATNNTNALVKQFSNDTKLIVTTIQKLNTAIHKPKYLEKMDALKNERVVFIFDECHRSQFGDTHNRIKNFFKNAQMFGFTGTPIFADNSVKNALGKRTTKDLFEECLHKYVITDAIRDKNVLKFAIEYISTFKSKDENEIIDINVDSIDKAEVMEAPQRLNNITEYIINNHSRKTHHKKFTAIFCVNNVRTLIKYYELFKTKKDEGKHDLRVATIFSYKANELDEDANGFIPDEDFEDFLVNAPAPTYSHTREKLDGFISDYNEMFQTNYSTNLFYSYYQDIGKRVKHKQVDVLLVVNMFLTGFDSKLLNTIYVDKNLKYHGLIQAYSRTNRILNEVKSQGNVVSFRNLKKQTDEAITLFSNKDAIEEIIVQPYENYIHKFTEAIDKLKEITPTVDSVNDLPSETEKLEFVKAFRELMRLKNVLTTFTEFSFDDLDITEQEFEDYQSKYLDIRDDVKKEKEKVSILNDIDFELELIRRDEINVAYILTLLAKLAETKKPKDQEKQRKAITDILTSDTQLRSKKELIERFIEENLPLVRDSELVADEFDNYWTNEKKKAVKQLSEDEDLDFNKLVAVISNYLFTEKAPLRDDVIALMKIRPSLKERASVAERITTRIVDFVETFINGMG
ncbi:type I restriction endonuclease subunit R [Tenacibaculum maritimum]|uniref:type I restriction endonuclease subunit R n=1 Tax=Tenacibaculum maritimum TaxID=107401 RepID=UPI001E492BDF|nr:type I restriction endonuclease subunit R [Tenacibaculum maritimum]MCD9583056.1 type I restriction endonuclease subunit R [Tenacibaculum maritimum]MCD9636255.1 type I restriction endonuclease subunit R [Tenacibaculum maritimum]